MATKVRDSDFRGNSAAHGTVWSRLAALRPSTASNIVPASLLSGARRAAAKAELYVRSRQSYNGGFCFYKSEYVDEPNLHDTYHAVAALKLLGTDVPRADQVVQFLDRFRLTGPSHYFYYAFALDLLDRAPLIDSRRLADIRDLTVTVPSAGKRAGTSGWLGSTLRTLRLQRRFARPRDPLEVVSFINGLKAQGGYGGKPNLWDTCLCLSILVLLGEHSVAGDTLAFVEQLQVPSFGFALTRDSLMANLDVVYAGTECCAMLNVPVRYAADALRFVLACQSSGGGFSRAPDALPDIDLTHRALQIIGRIAPDALLASSGNPGAQ